MRKSRIGYLFIIPALLIFSLFLALIDSQEDTRRYHQHLEQPSQEDLESRQSQEIQAKQEERAGQQSEESRAGQAEQESQESGATQENQAKLAKELSTHLPVMVIETGGRTIPGKPIRDEEGHILSYETSEGGEEEILVTVKTVEREGVWHHADDEADIQAQALFRIRGNSSRSFAKSNYRVKLVENGDPEKGRKEPLLGMDSASEWALHGPFLDKTLIRNYMWMNLSAEIMGQAPDARFCELVLDGEYQGLYLLMETNTVSEGRVDIREYEEGDPVFSYMVRLEPKVDPEKQIDSFTFYTDRLEPGVAVELIYPTASNQTQEVQRYVETDFGEMERRLFSSEMILDPDSCWDYLDLKSFGDYYILQEYLAVNDMFSASTYFYKDVRGKLHIGPVWDYNNVLDNFFTQMPATEFLLSQKGWYGQLMKSPRFVNYVTERYRQLRRGVLSQEYVERYAKETALWLGDAVERNFQVWGYAFDPSLLSRYERKNPDQGESAGMALEELNPSSFEQAMEWMLEYAGQRGRWLDEHIDSLKQYCQPSKNAGEQID